MPKIKVNSGMTWCSLKAKCGVCAFPCDYPGVKIRDVLKM